MIESRLKWWQNPFTQLVAQVLVLILQPILLLMESASLLSVILVLVLLCAAIGNWSKKYTVFKIMACAICLGLGIAYYVFTYSIALKIAYIVTCCIVLAIALFMQINNIIHQKFITKNSLISCINTYILAGYLGASLAWLVEVIKPGAFYINHPVVTHQLHDFVYFSFVTLATLGYGDIIPVSEVAKITAVFISLFGQLYVTIFIAIILGKYLQQKINAS